MSTDRPAGAPSAPLAAPPGPHAPPPRPNAPPGSEVVLIAMVAANGVIGDGADQPWHLREDQRRFARLTRGHPVILGRRTWEAIGAPLPGRPAVVLTRDPSRAAAGATVARDPQQALEKAAGLPGGDQIWVLGGGQVYAALLPAATRVELTEVDADASGATTFPILAPQDWAQVGRDDRLAFAFVTYRRHPAPGAGPQDLP